jgi:hypothetical protein
MRARDVRAITFCATTILIVPVATQLLVDDILATAALTLAYSALVLTRPRMLRVYRRLRGAPDWSAYFDNKGTRFTPPPAPGRAPSSPRQAGRP